MRNLRPLVLFLGLLGPGGVCALVSTPAHAQPGPDVFSGPGLIEIVPAGDIIGDGETATTIHVVALTPEGSPMEGLTLKPDASSGDVEGWNEVQAGVYAFTFTPDRVMQPATVTLRVRGRTPSRESVDKSYKVPVRPPTATAVEVVANPPRLVLGQDGEGSISFVLADAAGNVEASDIAVRSSSGRVENLTHLGGGRFTARYVPPRVNFPQLSIITAVDLRNPDTVYGAVAVPLLGKTDYPVQAGPGSNVVLRIGGREYGPVQASPTGRAAVPVVVPPGVQLATKVEVRDGQTLEDEIDLRVPETARLAMLPTQPGVPADGATAVPVRVAVFTPEGQPDTGATLSFSSTGGTVTRPEHVGQGIYEARFTPRFSNVPVTAEITANIAGSSIQTATSEVRLVPARPQAITLTAQPRELSADATALRVFAKVIGSNGQGLDRRDLVLSVSGATVKDGVQDLRNGDYRVDFSADGRTNVDVVATVRNPETGNPLRHVLLFPQTDVAPNDGSTANRITVVTVDEFGYPVPDVDVNLKIETGDGTLQPAVRTNDGGVGQVFYTSGRGAGMVRIRARSGNRTGITAFVQGPPSLRGLDVPPSGGPAERQLTNTWERLVVPLRVPREGAVDGPVSAETTASSDAGALARLAVRAEPATAAAGGRVTMYIDAKDAQGVGVAGQELDLIVSQGQAGAVSDLGGGRYQVEVLVPRAAAGQVKVSVASGDTATFARIPISGVAEDTGGWGSTDGVADGGSATDTIAPPPEGGGGGTSGGNPDLNSRRVRLGYVTSSYAYEQAPLPDNGPLLPAVIAVGGDRGSPALPQGAELAFRGWFLDYFGIDASTRLTAWSLQADAFGSATVPDQIVDVNALAIARYPFAVGDDHFWVGARAGYQGSDILYFSGSFEAGAAEYRSLYVQGLGLGGELGAEVGDLYIHGNLDARFVGVSRLLGLGVDAHVGYDITDFLFADLGFGYRDRQVTVLGELSENEVGELSDRQILGRIGVGYRF